MLGDAQFSSFQKLYGQMVRKWTVGMNLERVTEFKRDLAQVIGRHGVEVRDDLALTVLRRLDAIAAVLRGGAKVGEEKQNCTT